MITGKDAAADESYWFDPDGFTCPGPMALPGDTLWIAASVDGALIPVYLDPVTAPGPTGTIPEPEPSEEPVPTGPPGPATPGSVGPDARSPSRSAAHGGLNTR